MELFGSGNPERQSCNNYGLLACINRLDLSLALSETITLKLTMRREALSHSVCSPGMLWCIVFASPDELYTAIPVGGSAPVVPKT